MDKPMDYISISGWNKMQHYTKRNPPWIKLYAEILDDEDFEFMPDMSKLLYFCLLPFASRKGNKIKNNIAWLNRKLPIDGEIKQEHLQALIDNGFVKEYDNDSDLLALCTHLDTPETEGETETETETKKKGRFAPPSPIEVHDYAKEIGFNLDGNAFVDFYAAKGWKVGKNGMKDWKAAVRTWKSRHIADNPPEKKRSDTCHSTDCENKWAGTFENRQYCTPCLKKLRGY